MLKVIDTTFLYNKNLPERKKEEKLNEDINLYERVQLKDLYNISWQSNDAIRSWILTQNGTIYSLQAKEVAPYIHEIRKHELMTRADCDHLMNKLNYSIALEKKILQDL